MKIFQFIFQKEVDNQFVSVSEIIHNKNTRKNKEKIGREEYLKTSLKWDFRKYDGKIIHNSSDCEFFPMSSSKELNNGLSAESITEFNNKNETFEHFEIGKYDQLIIRMNYVYPEMYRKRRPYIGSFISLIFEVEWNINTGFDHIEYHYKDIASGELIVLT